VVAELFDKDLRALRRDCGFRKGVELFLYERAFADCFDRIGLIQRRFRSALLIGCPDPEWLDRLRELVDRVAVVDPGAAFARAAGGEQIVEDELVAVPGGYDLCVAIGTLDTVNDLPQALTRIQLALGPGAFFLGAVAGGDTLPQLRAAMRAADQVRGSAVPHVHPRIEAAALAPLLSGAGFTMPVVDVDRVQVSYESLARLIEDLRRMGATNILSARSRRPLAKAERSAAFHAFASAQQDGRTTETFEILHFGAWTPPDVRER
jgi:NADH dehydrogenase [ubiquinone] 1 alpha subcomplex assembly factor 5